MSRSSNATRDRLVRALRSYRDQAFEFARTRAVPWAKANPRPAALIAGAALLFLLVFVGSLNYNSGPRTGRIVAARGSATRPTTQSAAGGQDSLFDPSEDPEWGLPEELSTADVRSLVTRVEKLRADTERLQERLKQYYKETTELTYPYLTDRMWKRLVGQAFRRPELPLLYYEVMSDKVGYFGRGSVMMAEMSDGVYFATVESRIAAAQVRLFGGKCLVGDTLFIRALQSHLDGKHAWLDGEEPKRARLMQLVKEEFEGTENSASQVGSAG